MGMKSCSGIDRSPSNERHRSRGRSGEQNDAADKHPETPLFRTLHAVEGTPRWCLHINITSTAIIRDSEIPPQVNKMHLFGDRQVPMRHVMIGRANLPGYYRSIVSSRITRAKGEPIMSYDPNQPPNSGYGNSPYVQQQPPNGQPKHGQPQGPYGQPQQGPYGPPPQGPYGQPQAPYGYGAPPQGPYGAPYQEPGYGMPPVQAAPLPLGEAIRQLPNPYIRVLTKPSAATFAEEQGKAAWNIVWIQLIIYAIAAAVLGYLAILISPNQFSTAGSSTLNPGMVQAISLSAGFGLILLVPIFFFIGVGIYYLIAKAFGGQGTFLAQSYTTLLYGVPIGILSSVLRLIPILGSLAAIALGIYGIVLQVFAIMAVHRLSGGKATAVVLIPVAIAFVLVCVLVIIIIAAVASQVPTH